MQAIVRRNDRLTGFSNALLRFPIRQRLAHLFAVADRVVCAEWDHAPVGGQEFDAAFHGVLDVEGPGVHKVAGVDHEDVAPKIARGVFA